MLRTAQRFGQQLDEVQGILDEGGTPSNAREISVLSWSHPR